MTYLIVVEVLRGMVECLAVSIIAYYLMIGNELFRAGPKFYCSIAALSDVDVVKGNYCRDLRDVVKFTE